MQRKVIRVSEVFLAVTNAALAKQDSRHGFMPPGRNGPYGDPETPVRNTAHWLLSFLKAYELTGEEQYRTAADRTANYLVGPMAPRRIHSYTHREGTAKDSANGLIGSAWVIEALVLAAQRLSREDCLKVASEVFLAHPFDIDQKLWRRVEPDGSLLSADASFNHQLWFCAAGALLAPFSDDKVSACVVDFISSLNRNVRLARNGRIFHLIPSGKLFEKHRLKRIVFPKFHRNMVIKEIGYQAFNLYALALLVGSGLGGGIPSSTISAATAFTLTAAFSRGMQNNPYSYSYNPPGFELPFAYHCLLASENKVDLSRKWIEAQLDRTYDGAKSTLSRNCADAETLTARMYECTRFPDGLFEMEIELRS